MNFINRIAIVSAICFTATLASAADPVISLSFSQVNHDRSSLIGDREKDNLAEGMAERSLTYELDFIAGDKGAAVVQFDVVVNGMGDATMNLSQCDGKSVAGSDHVVFCRQISPDRVRVLVDSPTNAIVPTTSFGTIFVAGGRASIDRESVVVGDPQAVPMTVEVL